MTDPFVSRGVTTIPPQKDVPPATFGVAHGSGFLGSAIRWVEDTESKSPRFPAGDHEAAWAGHVVVSLGGGRIIQAEWPVVTINAVPANVIWATGQPLTGVQRADGLAAIRPLAGTRYDAAAYAYFLAKLAEIPVTHDFAALEAQAAKAGPICSGIMVRCQLAMGVNLGALRSAAIQDPDFISPADCLRYGLDMAWMDAKVPPW